MDDMSPEGSPVADSREHCLVTLNFIYYSVLQGKKRAL
jgi:hypothetical protein